MRQTLPGFRDFYPHDCAIKNYVFETFRRVVRRFQFEEVDAPTLEPLELFTDKSGPEIVEQLFNFVDRGGRAVALRPEFTPSLARLVGHKAAMLRRPIRWCNISENFRYERPQKGRLRAFYQMNCDLIGGSNSRADGELISLLINILREFGLSSKDFRIRLSDRQLWVYYLQTFGLSIEQIWQVLSAIDKMEREPAEIILAKLNDITPSSKAIYDGINILRSCKTLEDLEQFFTKHPSEALQNRLNDWKIMMQFLADADCDEFIAIDLSIVRGLAYYTGFVFEAFERSGENRALAGGGRYDDLVEKLTGTDLCATGFAIGDVTLSNLLAEKNLLPKHDPSPDAFIIFEEATQSMALKICNLLRKKNLIAVFDLNSMATFAKQLKQADKSGAHYAIFIGTDEVQSQTFTVKNLRSGALEKLSQDLLLEKFSSQQQPTANAEKNI